MNYTILPIIFILVSISVFIFCNKTNENTNGFINKGDYFFCMPPKSLALKSTVRYPLFVYLNGYGAKNGYETLPCFTTQKQRELYPAFIYIPHGKTGWNYLKLIKQIEKLKTTYPIDTNRLYLMGHSMGGSGSYALANEYYKQKGHFFAAIVRMVGQSQPILQDSVAQKTSVWYHIGLADTDQRVLIARQAYAFLKAAHSNAQETQSFVAPETQHAGKTWTLSKNGIEIVKYSEYDSPCGHGINKFPLQDPNLLKWLFSRALQK